MQYLPASPTAGIPFSQGQYQCYTPNTANTRCTAAVSYAGGNQTAQCGQGYAGVLVADTLFLGGLSATVSIVAMTAIQNGFPLPPTSGIMGIAFPSINNNCGNLSGPCEFSTQQPVAIDLLLAASGLPNEFSLCMGSPTSAGRFVLGGTDPAFYTGTFQNATINASSGFYGIDISSVSVGVNREPLAGGITLSQQASEFARSGPVVDSGTATLNLPDAIYNAINDYLYPCTTDADCVVNVHLAGGTILTAPNLMTCQLANNTCSELNGFANPGGTIIG